MGTADVVGRVRHADLAGARRAHGDLLRYVRTDVPSRPLGLVRGPTEGSRRCGLAKPPIACHRYSATRPNSRKTSGSDPLDSRGTTLVTRRDLTGFSSSEPFSGWFPPTMIRVSGVRVLPPALRRVTVLARSRSRAWQVARVGFGVRGRSGYAPPQRKTDAGLTEAAASPRPLVADVRGERRVEHLDRLEPEGLDSVEQPLAGPEQDGDHVEREFVDHSGGQRLTHG